MYKLELVDLKGFNIDKREIEFSVVAHLLKLRPFYPLLNGRPFK